MSEDVSKKDVSFDLDQLKTLVEMMDEYGMTEVSLRRGDEHWRLRRGPQEVTQVVPASSYSPSVLPTNQSPSTSDSSAGNQADNSLLIKSPTVGTFYSAPTPEEPAYVTVGTKVQPETIVCIVEAMKVFNQIPAEVHGTIVELLANNGDSVEFGQPLFRLQPG